MGIMLEAPEITQKKVDIVIDYYPENSDKPDYKSIEITLTKTCGVSWTVTITAGTSKLTVEQLIEICNLMYSETIIDEKENIVIYFNSKRATYIRGPQKVTSEILKAVEVTLFEPDKK